MKTGVSFVLYNPNVEFVSEVITALLPDSDFFYIIDNSEPGKKREFCNLVEKYPQIRYYSKDKNLGIAEALNLSCKLASEDNCSWLLTLDQDSKLSNLKGFKSILPDCEATDIGIFTPFHNIKVRSDHEYVADFEDIKSAMTSGNFLNLYAFKQTGIFCEKLFIDYVDHEYCLRLRKNGFRIVLCNFIILNHQLGSYKTKSFFGKEIGYSNHTFQRRYYITRNRLFVLGKYFFLDWVYTYSEIRGMFIDIFLIVFFETDTMRKLFSIFSGIFDFLRGRYGRKFL